MSKVQQKRREGTKNRWSKNYAFEVPGKKKKKIKVKSGFKIHNVRMEKDDLSKLQQSRLLQTKYLEYKKRCESPQWLQTESRCNSDVDGNDYATKHR